VSRAQDERRAEFKRYKEDVDKRGKAFFPYAMFHDTVMSLVVVCVIVGLSVVWYMTSGEAAGEEGTGWLGARYTEEADPGTTNFIPRPDWYFFFLFYLLRIFDDPNAVILGTVGVPTIALVLMLALPFIDRRRERRLLRRPVAIVAAALTAATMGVLTWKGATVREAIGVGAEEVEVWMEENNLPEEAREGALIFAGSGCLQCHTYAGSGSANLGAPELTAIGAEDGKDEEYFARYVANPRAFGNNVMQQYGEEFGGSLSDEELQQLGVFLEASKGGE
jgi:mono/diheme cytochrome c family protein